MRDERIIDLVNGELDGVNSPSDRTELATLVENDPSVKEYLDEMRRLDQLLAAVPAADPPATLKAGVMRAIAQQEDPLPSASAKDWFERLLAPFLLRPAWAVTYAFAVGVIVGLGVLSIIESTGPDSQTVQGTIVDHSPTIAQTQIAAGTATAGIVVTGMGDELRVDMRLSTPGSATISLTAGNDEPIVIESAPGSPTYSLVLPWTQTISVTLSSQEARAHAVVAIDSLNGQ